MLSNVWREHEKFKNVAAGAQSLVVAFGVILGGLWAAFTFYDQRLDVIGKLEAQLKYEQLIKESDVTAEITVESIQKNHDENIVFGTLNIENRGTKGVLVELRNRLTLGYSYPPLHQQNDFIQLRVVPLYFGVGKPAREQMISAKSGEKFPFTVVVRQPGMYMLSFVTQASAEESKKINPNAKGAVPESEGAWHAVKYFVVP